MFGMVLVKFLLDGMIVVQLLFGVLVLQFGDGMVVVLDFDVM